MSKTITSTNPFTEEDIRKYDLLEKAEIENILQHVDAAFSTWSRTDMEFREELMMKASQVLLDNKEKYAMTMTEEMGKPLKSAVAEIEKCAWVCSYYAKNSSRFLSDEVIETDARKSKIVYRPIGAVLAVMPWNYPFWQVFRFAAPTLMAGNVGLLKHASNVPQSALFIQEVFEKAGFPKNVFRTLLIKSDQVEDLIKSEKVKAVTLTGSGPAGSSVASLAGKHLKKSVLELGGSDPYIILEDADLELAAEQCVSSRLLNNGQSCIGAKRFIVLEGVYDLFLTKFKKRMESATMGNPMEDVDLGPLARKDLRNEVHQQVQKSVDLGAKLTMGGYIPETSGYFYPATILEHVRKGMPAYDEEIFGPVATMIKVSTEAEAIRIANDTTFGLGSCVFTKDLEKGERIASYELQSGAAFVNQFVKSDPRLPFGGIGASGYGRELSHLGIREFMNIKTVYIK